MTPIEYEEAKIKIAEYERTKDLQDKYIKVRDTGETVVIKCRTGEEIEFTGADIMAVNIDFINAKIEDIEKDKVKI